MASSAQGLEQSLQSPARFPPPSQVKFPGVWGSHFTPATHNEPVLSSGPRPLICAASTLDSSSRLQNFTRDRPAQAGMGLRVSPCYASPSPPADQEWPWPVALRSWTGRPLCSHKRPRLGAITQRIESTETPDPPLSRLQLLPACPSGNFKCLSRQKPHCSHSPAGKLWPVDQHALPPGW